VRRQGRRKKEEGRRKKEEVINHKGTKAQRKSKPALRWGRGSQYLN
jgi:hypothetical protein